MKKTILFPLAAFLSFSLTLAQGENEENHPFCFDDMIAMKRLSDPQPSPDGKWIAFEIAEYSLESNKGVRDIWLVSADGTLLKRLTSSPAQDTHPRWSPDGRTIAFISSRGGSSQIWTIRVDGGEAQQLTRFPLDVDNVKWSPSGTHLAFTAEVYPTAKTLEETSQRDKKKEEDPVKARTYTRLLFRHWDQWEDGKRRHIFVMPAEGGEPVDLMRGLDADSPTMPFGGSEEFAWSPDSKEICFTSKMAENPAWSTDVDLYIVKTDGTGFSCITEENKAWDTFPVYSPDGRTLAYLAMKRPGYESDRFRVVLYDRESGSRRVLTEEWDRSPGELAWAPDGKSLFAAAPDRARRNIFRIDVESGKGTEVLSGHYNDSLRVAGERIVFLQDSFTSPKEIFSCRLDGRELLQLTRINAPVLERAVFGEVEEFWFPSLDGFNVHGWLIKPALFREEKRYPLAFFIHGGPQGSWEDHFHYRWNLEIFAGAGYVVAAIDFRGSTGYGQAFTDAIRGDWGGKPYQDLMIGLDHILGRCLFINPDRMAALGASFGGFMINWINGQTGRFKCLVCHDGGFDETASYYSTEELWFPEWEFFGPAYKNPEMYDRWSPSRYVQNWKTPTLFIHGAQDYRVVDTEGLSAFTACQRLGIPSMLLYFPDETHFVTKPRNSELWHKTVIWWLDKWLRDGG